MDVGGAIGKATPAVCEVFPTDSEQQHDTRVEDGTSSVMLGIDITYYTPSRAYSR